MTKLPPWVPCRFCIEFWCTLNDEHAHDCDCPPVDEWEMSPYEEQIA